MSGLKKLTWLVAILIACSFGPAVARATTNSKKRIDSRSEIKSNSNKNKGSDVDRMPKLGSIKLRQQTSATLRGLATTLKQSDPDAQVRSFSLANGEVVVVALTSDGMVFIHQLPAIPEKVTKDFAETYVARLHIVQNLLLGDSGS